MDIYSADIQRRRFLEQSGKTVLAAGAALCGPSLGAWADDVSQPAGIDQKSQPESLVKLLYDSFSPKQRETVCFGWDHQDAERGLLRTRVANNWDITEYYINDDFYTADQQVIIRAIFEGILPT